MASDVCVERRRHRVLKWGGISLAAVLLAPVAAAEELRQPPICSASTVDDFKPEGICEVTPLETAATYQDEKRNRVKINLIAKRNRIQVGGYSVDTEHYNDSYLTPVVEAKPGDRVAARLTNSLPLRSSSDCHHPPPPGEDCMNPTNLHYFHGGIVTPNNARPKPAETGNGDNIYTYIKNGYSFDFDVPIPGKGELDARVLESSGYIEHPLGLNWYHSHLHGISSDQVMGGMSGLLSVGEANANVKAACEKDPAKPDTCKNDIDQQTLDLKKRTDVHYVLLRDIPLREITAHPEKADGKATAVWAPQDRDFPPPDEQDLKCVVWKSDGSGFVEDAQFRKGYCQRSEKSAWLFTLNGQRFPTVPVEGGRNLLLRLANVSANVAYWLELYKATIDSDGTIVPVRDDQGKIITKPLTILSLDGVVPASPVPPGKADIPVVAIDHPDLLLMPASRAEIFVRNDAEAHSKPQTYVLRAKELDVGTDKWPEIQLAQIVLEPNVEASEVKVALNAPLAESVFLPSVAPVGEVEAPPGCVRDLNPAKGEYRRVTFKEESPATGVEWSVLTQIVAPPDLDLPPEGFDESKFVAFEYASVGLPDNKTGKITNGIPFEAYDKHDGTIDWTGNPHKHVCIRLDAGKSSHKQLWVLSNKTAALHNFHIHQMKFRLATATELRCKYKIKPPQASGTCSVSAATCDQPDYKFYRDDRQPGGEVDCADFDDTLTVDDPKPGQPYDPLWHDTIPMPPNKRVFVIMSYDAPQQVGRFVYHCHILKHEDKGLMAPIEVWDPRAPREQ